MKTKLDLSFKALAEHFGVSPDAIDIEIMAQLVGATIVFPEGQAWIILGIRVAGMADQNFNFLGPQIFYDGPTHSYTLSRRYHKEEAQGYVLI